MNLEGKRGRRCSQVEFVEDFPIPQPNHFTHIIRESVHYHTPELNLAPFPNKHVLLSGIHTKIKRNSKNQSFFSS